MKEFIIQNKSKIIKWLSVALIMLSVLAVSFFVWKQNDKTERDSSKFHLLCIGVDKFEIMSEREKVYNSIGQADGIFLITINKDTAQVDIVAVPRDTIVTIQKYYSNMEYIGEEEAQICLQYAYADGMERSCELMVDRVEELFDGVEIDGYVAINMASVVEINEVIGGVTVEVQNEDTAQKMGVEAGSSVHLDYTNLSLYLQSRDKSEAKSAYGRMDRLKDYIKAFIPQALEVIKENPAKVTDMFSVLGENLVTNLDFSQITELTTMVKDISTEDMTYMTLEGEVVMGSDGYEEFYPDRNKLKKIIKKIR